MPKDIHEKPNDKHFEKLIKEQQDLNQHHFTSIVRKMY